MDQLIVPGLDEGRAEANMLPSGKRQQRSLKHDCKDHLDWLHARKWTFFALAAVYYPMQKQHRIFKDHPFFQNAEAVRQGFTATTTRQSYHQSRAYISSACRLFEELWIPLVQDSFSTGAKVYKHLCRPRGKDLWHAASMQPGHTKVPSNNAEKRQLLDTLVTLIDSNQHHAYVVPGQATKPEVSTTNSVATAGPSTPPPDAALTASSLLPRKLVFNSAEIDNGGIQLLMRVYLDGYSNFPPFIHYFPVPSSTPLPDQFRPEEARCPGWEADNLKDQWEKRRHLAFEVCRQASALQIAVNAKVPVFEARRQEEHRQSKKKYVERKVSIYSRTAARKVTALLQAAIQANKKTGCHPQSIETLSTMFRLLRAGKQDVSVHRSNGKNMPPSSVSARSLQGWLSIASSSDIDAMVAELYA